MKRFARRFWSRRSWSQLVVAVSLAFGVALALPTEVAPQTSAPSYREILGQPEGSPLGGAALARASHEVSSVLRCPVCQGLSVEDSPSGMAQNMRAQVREMVAAGYGEEQILSYFERSYGEFVRLEPRRRGFNWFVWLAPAGAALIGAVVIRTVLRRNNAAIAPGTARSADPASAATDELQPYIDRVRQEAATKE